MKSKSAAKKVVAYPTLVGGIGALLEQSRRAVARSVNCLMTATYWEVGRRIVEFEQGGKKRAEYGDELLERLAKDLTERHGRGFSYTNLNKYRQFFLSYSKILPTMSEDFQILPTLSGESSSVGILQTQSAKSLVPISATASRKSFSELDWVYFLDALAKRFPLPWSHYVRLLAVKDESARSFYEEEALRGGWSVRQLNRQIGTLFYERTLLSKNKVAMLKKGSQAKADEKPSVNEVLRDPLVLEFLDLKDEYSETDVEEALIRHLETFLLELGGDFTFVGRQRRLRIGQAWYRVDLIFYHRRLRCLVILELKLGEFTHADAGQMHLYLNYAREHWTHKDENPPVGIILCSSTDKTLVHYTLDSLPNKVLAHKYQLALPNVKRLEEELRKTRQTLEGYAGKVTRTKRKKV
ncbi:MAG TPA: PDDEXK nuclease domain-containing protein [Verrucomicrobiae bacterium]